MDSVLSLNDLVPTNLTLADVIDTRATNMTTTSKHARKHPSRIAFSMLSGLLFKFFWGLKKGSKQVDIPTVLEIPLEMYILSSFLDLFIVNLSGCGRLAAPIPSHT